MGDGCFAGYIAGMHCAVAHESVVTAPLDPLVLQLGRAGTESGRWTPSGQRAEKSVRMHTGTSQAVLISHV
jgi:hypothetical protein